MLKRHRCRITSLDHVLNIAYNGLERRNVPGRHRTAAQRCGVSGCAGIATDSGSDDGGEKRSAWRFEADDVECTDGIDQSESGARVLLTAEPSAFWDEAVLDADVGHLAETTGECKQGMDVAYDGTWRISTR